jgi:hypothetical protein
MPDVEVKRRGPGELLWADPGGRGARPQDPAAWRGGEPACKVSADIFFLILFCKTFYLNLSA